MSFIDWIDAQAASHSLTRAGLAKKAGISPSSIYLIAAGDRNPGPDLCDALAKYLRVSREVVYRAAGLLPTKAEHDELVERADHILNSLNPDTKKQALTYLEYLLQQQDRGEPHAKKNTGPLEPNSTI